MLITDKEAKFVMCCSNTERMCQGALCMGWRWHIPPLKWRRYFEEQEIMGYCGLAGKVTEE